MSTNSRLRHFSWIAFFSLMAVARLAAEPAQGRVRVYILAGQSNMEGKAKVQLLEYNYLGSARTLCAIGKAMADAVIALENGSRER